MTTTINIGGTVRVEVPDDFCGEEELTLLTDLDRMIKASIEIVATTNECDAKDIQLDFNIDNYE